ncbi:ornithine cyclodeaminase family protein [Thalassotalea sp. 1_MG-2023]|uniref:ornithine cyclodeaminase family protein n=1 Tax=Thalassotalea sp. 1_MG-2023 TaxID=3062680 RepID=UPI0026E45207|nr:ornithine cyclodeaminase family protein [Thalassotalea sp. 1_MG-2023]MDO6428360.1 ornithine cyclodeaminase family protein [Thalassotalea sp. 1_MG-2023]
MLSIDASKVNEALTFPKLVPALEHAFASDVTVPPRLHFDIENPKASRETTLLIMPAWQSGEVAGVKLVTVAPENAAKNLPSIQGSYLLFDVDDGQLIAIMDAPAITAKRTAAASALASSYLSRTDSETLLIIGTGTLASQLIEAHASVRPIKQVKVWGRTLEKAQLICDKVAHLAIDCQAVSDIEGNIADADIISCATLSQSPLIKGEWLVPGQHLDMVGAYRPDMREMDDDCVRRAAIYVDNIESALRETGDLAIPLADGVITLSDIQADLFSLCKKEQVVSRSASQITLFKSVGHALEDLAAAKLVAEHVNALKVK